MNEDQIRKIVQEEIATAAKKAQYGVTRVPVHVHNGTDAPTIPDGSIQSFVPLPASTGGVASPDVLGVQVINDSRQASNTTIAGQYDSTSVFVDPFPIIYGQGTGLFSMTGTPAAAATSATLTSAYPYPTGKRTTTFANGDTRLVTFTLNSTSITWSGGISAPNAGGSTLGVDGSPSSFAGGTAPVGTGLIFANPAGGGISSDGTTLWFRVSSIPNFTTGSFGLTASVSSGDSMATLSNAWSHGTGTFWITFSSGEQRPGNFTSGSTAITFGATTAAATSTITVSAVGWYGIEFNQLLPA